MDVKIDETLIRSMEIIHPLVFKELYIKEKPIYVFNAQITTNTSRPFFTFYSHHRKILGFKEQDLIIIKLSNKDREFQFISKIYKWGKIHVPLYALDFLGLKNHQEVECKIICKNISIEIQEKEGFIDLYGLKNRGLSIISRDLNYVTLYSKQKMPFTLPRFIRITPDLFELFFLVHGDGHYKEKLFFVNKNPELLQYVMEKFENILKIPQSLWRSRILLSDNRFKCIAEFYWKDKLNLKEEQFYSVSKSCLNTDEYGNLRIILDNTIISCVFRYIFCRVQEVLDINNSFYALNGLLCAEGGAQPGKRGLHKITLSFNQQEKKLFEKVLKKTGIFSICKVSQDRMYLIERWENHYIFFKSFLNKDVIPFSYHTERKFKAINGFLNHNFTKTLVRYLSVLKDYKCLSTSEFSSILKIRGDSVLSTIRKNRYQKFIRFKKLSNTFLISITSEGFAFLVMVEKLQEIGGLMEQKLPFEQVKRKINVKKGVETDLKYGQKPENRSVEELLHSGVINLNKPSGPS